jgi:F-type H+-transporting ATPase subunit b
MFETPEFWVAVGFVILVAGIAKMVVRSVNGALDARAARIKATLDEAAKLREDAQHLLAEYQRKQRNAVKEAEDVLAAATARAEQHAKDAAVQLAASLAQREKLALEKIALAEAEALKQVREAAVDVAIAATRKLIAERVDAARANQLIDAAIAELPQRLH